MSEEKKTDKIKSLEFEDRQKIIKSYRKSLRKSVVAPLSQRPMDIGNPWDNMPGESGEKNEAIDTADIEALRFRQINKDLDLLKWQVKAAIILSVLSLFFTVIMAIAFMNR